MKHLQKQKGGVGGRKLGRSRAFYSLLLTTLVAIAIYNSFAFFQKSEGNSILNYNRKNIQEKKKTRFHLYQEAIQIPKLSFVQKHVRETLS